MKDISLILCFVFLMLNTTVHAQTVEEQLKEIYGLIHKDYEKHDFQAGVDHCKEAAKIATDHYGEQDSTTAMFTNLIGFFYYELSQYKEAAHYYLIAKDMREAALGKEHKDYSESINNLAVAYGSLGLYQKAKKYYFQGTELSKQLFGERHANYARSLNNLASFYNDYGEYDEAEALYIKAIEIRKEALGENHPLYASTINNLAVFYYNTGKYEQAELLYLQAIETRKKALGETHPKYAISLTSLAQLYYKTERYDLAREYLEASEKVWEAGKGKNHVHYLGAVNLAAILEKKIGNYKKAERLLLEMLKVKEETFGKVHTSYASTLIDLGGVYLEMNEFEKAHALSNEAGRIFNQTVSKNNPKFAGSLNKCASIYLKTKELDKAFQYALLSLALTSDETETIFPATVESENYDEWLATALKGCSENLNEKTLKQLLEATYPNSKYTNACLTNILKITKAQYQTNDGIDAEKLNVHYELCKTAIKINNGMRKEFSADKNKLKLVKQNHTFATFGIQAAQQLGGEHLSEAFSFAEENKSILLADALKGSKARSLGDLPDSLIAKELQLKKQKDAIKTKKYKTKDREKLNELLAQENELNTKIEAFKNSLKNKYPKYHSFKYEEITAKASDLQQTLDNGSLMLEYFIADSTTFLFAIDNKDIRLFDLNISKEELHQQIKDMRNSLSDYKFVLEKQGEAYDQYTKMAHWFYEHLVAPSVKNQAFKKLIVVTDGELGHLPFEAFLVDKAAQDEYGELHYLINDYIISYNYSATLLLNSPHRSTANHKMLACAANYSHPAHNSRSATTKKLRSTLDTLPEAIIEVHTLSEAFEGTFLQDTATNEGFFKKYAKNYGIIHLAMHGMLHPKTPLLSSLVFTETDDPKEDNFLQAYEISQLTLNANLVVLSACETGYGQYEEGEGIISLARSFMYAGVPALVVSLWQVNDGSTGMIMKNFYEQLNEGMPKDEALRNAKLQYIKSADGIAAHPIFWSPFIQLGQVDALQLTGGFPWSWAGGIGLLLVLVLGFAWKKNDSIG